MILKPENFGAVGDGINNDSIAFQNMFNSIEDTTERRIYIELTPTAKYKFEQTVFYPVYNDRVYHLDGKSAVIKGVGNTYDLLAPGNLKTEDGSIIPFKGTPIGNALFGQHRWIIRDLRFEGGDTQLTTAATFKNVIENVEFLGGNIGYKSIFSLGGTMRSCWFNSYKKEGMILRSGQSDPVTGEDAYWPNSSATNSQSNVWTIEDTRFFIGKINTRNCIRAYASNSIYIRNCIMEGLPCKHIIDYDSKGSTTVTAFDIDGLHVEMNISNDPTLPSYNADHIESLLKLRQDGGMIKIAGLFSQVGGAIHIDNLGGCIIKCENWRYFPFGKFKGTNGKWIFENCYGLDNPIKTYWEGNTPSNITVIKGSTIEGVNGNYPTLKYNDDYIQVNPGRIKTTMNSILSAKDIQNTTPKQLSDYEIIDFIQYIEKDSNGVQKTNFIPILKLK